MAQIESRWVDLDGPTHVLSAAGPPGAPPLVAVHGLGGSAANWLAVLPDLSRDHHVYAIDLAGHGRTQPDRRSSEASANQKLLHRFVVEVVGAPVALLGNSMGGLISVRQAAQHPATVSELVLLGPALPLGGYRLPDPTVAAGIVVTAIPGLGAALLARRNARLTPAQQVAEAMDMCAVDSGSIPREALTEMEDVARARSTFPGTEAAIARAARSTLTGILNRRGVDRAIDAVRAPVLILHGEQDRLIPVESSRRAVARRPDWTLRTRADLGHVPQLEDPAWTMETIRSWRARRAAT